MKLLSTFSLQTISATVSSSRGCEHQHCCNDHKKRVCREFSYQESDCIELSQAIYEK